MSNSFGYIDIILLAMFAGFIFLRLKNVLGRRTGHQGKTVKRFELRGMEVLKDIENNEAIKSGNVDENAKKMFLKGFKENFEVFSPYKAGEIEKFPPVIIRPSIIFI